MHPELKKMCKQVVKRYAYVDRDDHNDYIWEHAVADQSVVLTDQEAVALHIDLKPGTVLVTSVDGEVEYDINDDYTVDNDTGEIARTELSTIPSGGTVHVSYSYFDILEFLARIENSEKLIRTGVGQEVLSTCQIYCDSNVVIDPKDKITSVWFDVEFPEILKIDKNVDENGNLDHLVIYTK